MFIFWEQEKYDNDFLTGDYLIVIIDPNNMPKHILFTHLFWFDIWYLTITTYLSYILVDCQVGHYPNASDDSACIPCEIGFYKDETGAVNCTACSSGFSTVDMGSDDVSDCYGKFSSWLYLNLISFDLSYKWYIAECCYK